MPYVRIFLMSFDTDYVTKPMVWLNPMQESQVDTFFSYTWLFFIHSAVCAQCGLSLFYTPQGGVECRVLELDCFITLWLSCESDSFFAFI